MELFWKAAGSWLLRCQEFYENPGKCRPIRRIGVKLEKRIAQTLTDFKRDFQIQKLLILRD
jgi:hypothetical protein